MDGHAVSPFNLSPTLPVGGGLLVPYSLSGSPVIRQLMQMVTMVPGQGGRFQSVCFPNRIMAYFVSKYKFFKVTLISKLVLEPSFLSLTLILVTVFLASPLKYHLPKLKLLSLY